MGQSAIERDLHMRSYDWLWTGLVLTLACQELRVPRQGDAGSPAADGGRQRGGAAASDGAAGAGLAAQGGASGRADPAAQGGSSGRAEPTAAGGKSGGRSPAAPAALSFKPANLPDGTSLDAPGALRLDTVACRSDVELDTVSGMLGGCDLEKGELKYRFSSIDQSDTTLGKLPAALLVTRRFELPQGMRLTVTGTRPLILVVLEDARIDGVLQANALGAMPFGGGFGPTQDGQPGLGPGGGGKPNGESGGAGGAFCGRGGDGGTSAGLRAAGGKPYGNPENVPLIGGSSGSKVEWNTSAGGGAIQISAGTRIEVGLQGIIHVGGGGSAWYAGGGGAGGAILLEAPQLAVHGHLAANGGGGASTNSADSAVGADAASDDQPALGGRVEGLPPGGNGAAGERIDGQAGGDSSEGRAAGGGGGAGRIRLNSAAEPDLSGALISPAQTTPCFSRGKL
jgi:hypothetical protein